MANTPTFQDALDHLLDSKKDIPQKHLPLYSDLDPKSIQLLMDVWREVKLERKRMLLETLAAHMNEDTIVSYEEIGRALLTDPDGEVRARAISLLAETEDFHLADALVKIILHDTELAPRVEAAGLLGKFILIGELEEMDKSLQDKIESALITVVNSEESQTLRRRALESLGYSSHAEVYQIIETAFQRSDPKWVASALEAMGRTHDEERWNEDVVSMLLSEDPRICLAAVRAAGELAIKAAAPLVMSLLDDAEDDDSEFILSAIWALSQIGGEEARVYLVGMLDETEDEDAAEFLEDALENLDFTDELNRFDLLAFEEDEEDEEEK